MRTVVYLADSSFSKIGAHTHGATRPSAVILLQASSLLQMFGQENRCDDLMVNAAEFALLAN